MTDDFLGKDATATLDVSGLPAHLHINGEKAEDILAERDALKAANATLQAMIGRAVKTLATQVDVITKYDWLDSSSATIKEAYFTLLGILHLENTNERNDQ